MVYVEPSFPRGRKLDTDDDHKPKKKFKKSTEYGASTASDEKPQKLRPKDRQQTRLELIEHEKEKLEHSMSAVPLHFKMAQAGMLIMGCVYKISKLELTISLPGRMFGTVPLMSISETYTNRLHSFLQNSIGGTDEKCPSLDELYTPGDLVYVKIKVKHEKDKRFGLTLDPKELHSEFNCKQLVEGLILSATIEEEEDHGYQMNIGIKNVRAFLPTHNVSNNTMLIGKNIFCAVQKVTQANGTATVILRAFKPTEPRKLEIAEANIDALVPGSIVTFTIESILSNGLKGTLFDDTVPAFVNENMLEKPLSNLKNYEAFKQFQARILYVMPVTKHVFLTLAHYDGNRVSVADPIAIGKVIKDAKIIHKSRSGVWLQIGKKHKALLPRYILKSKFDHNYDEQIVMAKYQINSTHTVRVMRYEVFDRTIIVTDDEKTIEKKYFTIDDLKVGEIYNCCITKVLDKKRGYLVQLDNVKGILTSHNFVHTKNYAVNQTIKLRLIAIEEDRKMAQFSNHPEYMKKSVKLVTDRQQIQLGQKYLGTVISEQDKFFLVAFCNKITGILFKYNRLVSQDQDRIARLKPGIVEKFTIHNISENGAKITLSIPIADGSQNLGHIVDATVTGIFATGADIYLVKENETGVIPPEMFSDFPSHNAIFQSVLKEGEQIPVVNMRENIYSCRDVSYFRRKPSKTSDVRIGQILRAYCVEVLPEKKKIHFRLALKDYNKRILLRSKELYSGAFSNVLIEEGQVILVKVIKRITRPDGVTLLVDPTLANVCPQGVDDALRFVQSYLNDVQGLIQRFKSRDKTFAQYTIGQSIMCVVESFIEGSDQMVVRLDGADSSETKGLATKDQKKDDYTIGEQLEGRIVWVDVEKQLVHVCVVRKYLKHLVDKEQASLSQEMFNSDIRREFVTLFQNKYVAVGCLSKIDCPLVIVPVKCHYNDFQPTQLGNKVQVVLVREVKALLLGMTEESFDQFNKFKDSTPVKKEKKYKHCWLPDDYEEPILDDPEDLEIEETVTEGHSDSGIDKDEDADQTEPTSEEPKKKPKKKLKKNKSKASVLIQLNQSNAVTSPAKALKAKKQKKKAIVKKLKSDKPFVISQLDGADDFVSKKHKNKKHFLSERPAAKAPPNIASKQSGSKLSKNANDKLHQLAQQTKFKGRKNKTNIVGKELKANQALIKPSGDAKAAKKAPKKDKLPGADGFWNFNPSNMTQDSESSDDDEQQEVQKKKPLNAKERFEAIKQAEKRIREIEEELADESVDPHTPDQFDRLVLAQPNSSLLWIQYMVFHMESAEVEKARAVARRALKTINFREEDERFNVWIALLNLELRYETVETFKEVLQEALTYNDPFKVYSRVIEMAIDCGKTAEASEIIELLQKRYRKKPEMWIIVADSYYKIGEAINVKPLLSKALKSLENKEHIPLILKFAFLYNRNGERDEAHILFEQILTSYPKRTDVWSQYVDLLVKDGMIDVARQTLDRAIANRLPLKNMKTLYTKYVAFEEKFGDRESVKRIKQSAADYVQKQLKLVGVTSGSG